MWERREEWKSRKGLSESSSTANISNHLPSNISGKGHLNNSSATLHSMNNTENNYLNNHPSAKYFSSMPRKSK